MEVKKKGKTLYHMQAIIDFVDDPCDIFVFSNGYPDSETIRKAYVEDFNCNASESEIDDFEDQVKIYTVYAQDADEL